MKPSNNSGFTLIELSIVLVIIGLIIGGILTGQDLINSAAQRAQIAQMEKYNTAVNTFYSKYGFLPGDIPNPQATNFGFIARGNQPGQGDGNGLIQGWYASGYSNGFSQSGEPTLFWVDLSKAGLIDASLTTATGGRNGTLTTTSSPNVYAFYPPAKIGNGNYIEVWSGGPMNKYNQVNYDGNNWFSISIPLNFNTGGTDELGSNVGLSVAQAYNIDKKMDDGLPQSGKVLAMFLQSGAFEEAWAAGGGLSGATGSNNDPTTNSTPYATTNCYDNNNGSGAQTYQMKNAGAVNCALSFQLQGAGR